MAGVGGADRRIAIMSGLMAKAPMERGILSAFEASTGIRTAVDWAPTTLFAQRIAKGERADVLIVTAEGMDGFVADGTIDAASRADVAEMTLGLGVRAGAPRPDISTLEAFRGTLLGARSIAVSRAGASGIAFRKIIAGLELDRELAPLLVTIESGLTGELVADGRAEMAVQQLSELGGVPGVDIVGPFPAGAASTSIVSAGVFAAAGDSAAARRFVDFLRSKEAAAIFASNWLRPLAATKGD